ncbi:MAG: hypothetical protein FWD25_08430 [Clostridia bacterium]|nr:hypothetical protein [Clostridia bacterium]
MKKLNSKRPMICLCIIALLGLSACTASMDAGTNSHILVVLPMSVRERAAESGELEGLEADLQITQAYFDSTKLDLGSPTLHFIPLRGAYTHMNQEMLLFGAFVNRHANPLQSFSGRIRMQADVAGMEIATITFDLPQDFVGTLQTDEALLLTFTVPVRGLEEDKTFEAYQFISEMIDVTAVEFDIT